MNHANTVRSVIAAKQIDINEDNVFSYQVLVIVYNQCNSFNCACDIDYNDISISSSVSHVSVPHSNIQKKQSSKRVCKATKIKQTSKCQL